MQDTSHFYHPYYQNAFDWHCYDAAHSANSAMSVPHFTPYPFTRTIVPTPVSREVELITCSDSSLSTTPRAAVNFGHFTSPPLPNVLNGTPTMPPSTGHVHYTDIHLLEDQLYDAMRERLLELPLGSRQSLIDRLTASNREDIDRSVRPRWIDGKACITPALTPSPNQSVDNTTSGSFIRPSSSQVPSGTTNREFSRESTWLPRGMGDTCHAVEWPARPQPRLADAVPQALRSSLYYPAFFEVENGLISQTHLEPSVAGPSDDFQRMLDPITEQVPSSPLPHRNHRRSRDFNPRVERTFCYKCQKTMLRQSLKRHMKEVHENVKRPRRPSFIVVTP